MKEPVLRHAGGARVELGSTCSAGGAAVPDALLLHGVEEQRAAATGAGSGGGTSSFHAGNMDEHATRSKAQEADGKMQTEPSAATRETPVAAAATEPRALRGARVEARGLVRRFGDRIALDDLSLAIEPGEALALLGANGAGKTTFIRLVTGWLLPSAGTVTVDGLSPARDSAAVHARIGYVAETSRLYPELRVRGLLRFAGGIRGLAGDALDSAVDRALDRFELRAVAQRLVGHLSKGFQQRVSLAQGLLHDPPLLIVDEPSSGLDPRQRAEVRSLLASLRGRRTLILCTHDLAEARAVAPRVAVLRRGRLVAHGPAAEVLDREDPLALFGSRDGDPAQVGS